MDSLTSLLPQQPGLLPKWLLFISVVSLANSAQAYSTLHFTQRVYSGPAPHASSTKSPSKSAPASSTSPVTALSARTFGTWTAISSIVRLYTAYHIANPQMYQLALWTFGIAWAHFIAEWWVFRTARWSAGLAGPVVVSSATLVWMVVQWGWYVK